MKRFMFVAVLLVMVLTAAMPAAAQGNPDGMPNGPHYNLNIIGVPKDKNPDMNGNSGHRIFVDLEGGSKIYLIEADETDTEPDFAVLDANGTDGRAEFMLPLPAECWATEVVDPVTGEIDIVTPDQCTVRYQVWARALGAPGGNANMYTCVEDPDLPGGYLCSVGEYWVTLERRNGRSAWDNVTAELLFVSANFDNDPAIEHVQIFDPMFDQYYWQYDNQGLKLAQLRFYMGDYTVRW